MYVPDQATLQSYVQTIQTPMGPQPQMAIKLSFLLYMRGYQNHSNDSVGKYPFLLMEDVH